MSKAARSALFLYALLPLALLCLRSLNESSGHLIPVNDEISVLDLGRGNASDGVFKTIVSYWQGRILEVNRHPLHNFLLSTLIDSTPRDFSRAKLLTLAEACLLALALFFLSLRRWGWAPAVIALSIFCLSPVTAMLSQQILCDVLFALFYFAALTALMEEKKSVGRWVWFGTLAGLAYLTKANGYLLFVAGLASGLNLYGMRFFLKPFLYAALLSFFLIASFLIVRNFRVWGNPFASLNNKVFWLDGWSQHFLLSHSPEWDRVGPRWFLEHHTGAQIISRFFNGCRSTAALFIVCLAVGPDTGWTSFITGCVTFGFALFGFFTRWRNGHKNEVIVVLSVALVLCALFSFTAEINLRYIYPVAVSFIPFAALGLSSFLSGRSLSGLLMITAAGLIGVCSHIFVPRNPLGFYAVSAPWKRTSDWIRENIGARPFLINNWSFYSPWDCCRDNRYPFPFEIPSADLKGLAQEANLKFALVDHTLVDRDPYPDKYGPEDAYGPITFMGWSRCYHDAQTPSWVLIFSPVCPET